VFAYQAQTNLPAGIWVDKKRLRQALVNLLGNAVKFTEHGCVTLRVSVVSTQWSVARDNGQLATDDGQRTTDRIRFEVADTGVGINADDLPRLFHPFEQAGDIRQRGRHWFGFGD
jgi:signal transduction histidine kinase